MKLVQSLVVAALVAVPALSFAQQVQPLTRAQVKAELVQLQQAGYRPATDNTQYPENLQAALSRVNAAHTAAVSSSGYGGVAQGASASGKSASARAASPGNDQDVVGLGPIYAHS